MKERAFSLARATAIIAVFTLVSRVVGFVRELLLASHFGAGNTLDIYYSAFRLPDTIYNFLILGTLSVAFIPVFNEYYLKDRVRAHRIANSVLNGAGLIMLIVCAGLFIFAKPIMHLVVPGFIGDKFNQTVALTRLMLVSPVIFTISSIFSSYLTSLKRFFIISLAPVLYNVGIIFGLFFLYPHFGLMGLGYGVLLGAGAHLIVQAIAAFMQGFRWQPVLDLRDAGVRKIGILFVPRVLALDISYISLLIASIVGSLLPAGSIAIYTLATNLQAVAVGIFALSVATAIFPVLTELHAQEAGEEFVRAIRDATIRILFFMVPISFFLLIFRGHIVRLAYVHGQFNEASAMVTFNTFGVLVFAVLAQSLVPLFARAFYARQNTKTPLIISLCAMVINAAVSYVAALHYGVVGIALGFSVASIFNCLALYITLRFQFAKIISNLETKFDKPLLVALGKIVSASIVGGLVSFGLIYLIAPYINAHSDVGILEQATVAGIGGVVGYLVIAYMIRLREVRNVLPASLR